MQRYTYGHISLEVPNIEFDFDVSVAKHRFQISKSKLWGHGMSHLPAIMRPHHFDFHVRFLCISALMSKTIHRSQIWRLVLSLIYANDQRYSHNWATIVHTSSSIYLESKPPLRLLIDKYFHWKLCQWIFGRRRVSADLKNPFPLFPWRHENSPNVESPNEKKS